MGISWRSEGCPKCLEGRRMPDGSLFCVLTMDVARGRCSEYKKGMPDIYPLEQLLRERAYTGSKSILKPIKTKRPITSKTQTKQKKDTKKQSSFDF